MLRRLLVGGAASLALLAGTALTNPVTAQAATKAGARVASRTTTTTGYDISYPQCSSSLPKSGAFAVVGVTYGKPYSANPCLAAQYAWAATKPQPAGLYMNTANPGPVSVHWNTGGPESCADPTSFDDAGCAYDYGWNAAADAFSTASATVSANPAALAWWLDVETANSWNGSGDANAAALQGSVDYLHMLGVTSVGIYSTGYQWGLITGGYTFSSTDAVSNWVAGGTSLTNAKQRCAATYSFSGGRVKLSQYPAGSFDGDYVCY